MRSGHGDLFRCIGAIWLVLFESSESRELVANLDHAILVGFEKESNVSIVDHRRALVFSCFLRRKTHLGIDPSLVIVSTWCL